MAILDAKLTFSDKQAATASANSTDVVDLGVDYAVGVGYPLKLLFSVSSDFNGTVSAKLQGSDDNSTFEDMITSKTYDQDDLTKNREFVLPIPYGAARYLRLAYTIASATAGTISAGIVLDADQYTAFANGSVDDWEYQAATG